MGIYAIKPWFRGQLAGVTQALVDRGVTADQVTWAGLAASGCGGLTMLGGLLDQRIWLLVPVWAFLRIAANALDGLVAQVTGTGRPAGELFNETADRLADFCFIAPIAALPNNLSAAWPFAALAAAYLASYVGVAAKAAGASRRYDGPMGKPDRMAVVSLAAVVAAFVDPPTYVWAMATGAVLAGALVTTANRLRTALGELAAARQEA